MIKNLPAALPELGKIKMGMKGKEIESKQGKKFRPPMKLNHFIITTMERTEDGDLVADDSLMEILKKSDAARKDNDGNLTGIPIRLLYNDIDLNFPTRLAAYVGGKCVCSGDGEAAKTRAGLTKECPCDQVEPTYDGKEKCKYNGKLYCVIEGTTSVGACHVLRTTSFNTVQSIIGGLAFIQAAAGGQLAFLPLLLVITPKSTVVPTTGAPVTVYVASIVYNGNINELRQSALGMAQDKAKYLIDMDSVEEKAKQAMEMVVESEEEQQDVQDEFYPDAIDIKPAEKAVDKKLKTKPKPETEVKKETLAESIENKQAAPDVEKTKTKTIKKAKEDLKEPEEKKPDEPIDFSKGPVPITDDQKRIIVKLKTQLKMNKEKLVEIMQKIVPGILTAVDLTTEEADVLIAALNKEGDIPF